MKKNKAVGITLLVICAFAIFGSIVNGTFADMGNQNIFYCIGYFGTLATLLVVGILKLVGKKEK